MINVETVETADGKQIKLKTGLGSINLRDVPHGGFQGHRRQVIEVVTVHVVDKGAPLY